MLVRGTRCRGRQPLRFIHSCTKWSSIHVTYQHTALILTVITTHNTYLIVNILNILSATTDLFTNTSHLYKLYLYIQERNAKLHNEDCILLY